MSDDRMFERAARAWLEQGPTEAPDHVVEAALLAIEATSQQRDLRMPWRKVGMTTPVRLAITAIGVLVIGGGFLLLRGLNTQVGTPSPSQSPTILGSPKASATALQGDVSLKGWIVFEFGGPAPDGSSPTVDRQQIWLVRADGSGLHELAPGKPAANSRSFDISPDGQKVVFPGGPGPQIWEVPIEGGTPTLLSTNCAGAGGQCGEQDPAYSPDGTKIAFVRSELSSDKTNLSWVIGVRDLTSGTVSFVERTRTRPSVGLEQRLAQPTWSPDGSQIAYQQFTRNWANPALHLPFDQTRIEVVHLDGTGLHELPVPVAHSDPANVNLAGLANAGRPDWSSDGSVILFSTKVDVFGSDDSSVPGGFYTIHPDGTQLATVCTETGCLGWVDPSWTPDGKHILFWSSGSWALMDPDGRNPAFINQSALTFPGIPSLSGAFALIQPTP